MAMLQIGIYVGLGIAVLVALGWLFHRVCTRLEEAGYLYYRKKQGSGGGSNVLMEMDKLTRPSVQHVIEAEDTAKIEREEIGGE